MPVARLENPGVPLRGFPFPVAGLTASNEQAVERGARDVAPHDPDFQKIIADVLIRIEEFFLGCVEAGQAGGTITRSLPAANLARHLLGVLLGVRVLARVRPERALLERVVAPALALLDGPCEGRASAMSKQ